MKKFIGLLLIVIVFGGCDFTRPRSNLNISFSFQDSLRAPATVTFDQEYEHYVLYEWDFGDGSEHSTLTLPSHTYENPGKYQVTLTASDRGRSRRLQKWITIKEPLKEKIFISKIILNNLSWKNLSGQDWDTGSGPDILPYVYMTHNITWYSLPYLLDVQKSDLPLHWVVPKQEPFYKNWHPEIHFFDYDFGKPADELGVIHLEYDSINQDDTVLNIFENGLDVTLHLRFE